MEWLFAIGFALVTILQAMIIHNLLKRLDIVESSLFNHISSCNNLRLEFYTLKHEYENDRKSTTISRGYAVKDERARDILKGD
jgi:hypothetical protein